MKMIRCRKCGASMISEDGLIERMSDTIHELNEKARKSKDGRIAKSYLAEAASVCKLMKGVIHNTTALESRKITCQSEYSELVYYLRSHGLISEEKLQEIREIARKKAKQKDLENQKELDRIYGQYKKLYMPANKTKADPTAKKAIKQVNRSQV